MNILLIDVDGKLPNLALMKLSWFFKSQGYKVYLNNCPKKPDKVFISTLFTWNKNIVEELLRIYTDAEVGGTGWDIKKTLPEHIENCKPDYELYQVNDIYKRIKGGIGRKVNKIKKAETIVNAGMGFTSRGCIRNCNFCFVPPKEGNFHQVASISDLINPKSNVLILLDNNITADPDVIEKLHEIRDRKLIVDISQGIDVRLITPEIAQALSEVKHLRSIHYAWDLMPFEKQVLEGIKILSKFIKAYRQMCFVLTGYNTSTIEDEYRFQKLRELNIDPYIMPYNKTFPTTHHKHFTRWVNGRYYKACKFDNYEPWAKEKNKQFNQMDLWEVLSK